MEFRDATLDDLDEIATLFHSCWHISYADLLSREVREAMTLDSAKELWRPSLIEPKGKSTVIGTAESKLVSVFRIGPDPSNNGRGHLFSLYVDPAASGKGFGRASLTEAGDRLERSGFKEISLWVFAQNEIARGLYESFGFAPTGITRIDDRWRESEIEMLKVVS